VLRGSLSVTAAVLAVAMAAAAQVPAHPDSAAGTDPPVAAEPLDASGTHDLLDLRFGDRDAWYVRGFDSLFAREEPGLDEAARSGTAPIDAAFQPYAGLRIRRVVILGREAFGTLVPDTSAIAVEDEADTLQTSTSPFTSFLNAVTAGTRPSVIRNYLLFQEGDLIDPAAMADSERLLRDLAYTSDAKIEVVTLPGAVGLADVFVLVRDRWPLGAQAKIHTQYRYDVKIFHRNLGGVGLNVEVELPYEANRTPETGWRAKAGLENLAGSFVDVTVEAQHVWSLDRRAAALERRFVHPDIQLIGGLGLARNDQKDHPELPPGLALETRTLDTWLGWGFRLRDDRDGPRLRLVPAVRVASTDFVNPPLEYTSGLREWRDIDRYLGQLTLSGIEYYTAHLVLGYGETEDLPSGAWAAFVGGFETGEASDRLYHGARFVWPRVTGGDRYLTFGVALGGFRRGGRLEDGVLDLYINGFAPLRRQSYGAWRHFYGLSYTRGLNRRQPGGLRLDAVALRDLSSDAVAGNQRLAIETESVLFTRYALLGFKAAAFGYVAGGFVGPENDFPAYGRFNVDLAAGLRLNNPRLVFPTIELRAGVLSTAVGSEPVFSVSMSDLDFLRRLVPSAKPELVPFR
jgi:hypothetical protein